MRDSIQFIKGGKVVGIVSFRNEETAIYDIRQCNKCSLMCYDRKHCAIRDEKQGFRPKGYE